MTRALAKLEQGGVATTALAPAVWLWPALLGIWAVLGAGCGAAITTVGRLIRGCGSGG
ncbi:MAG TPA: hypothetical protein VFV67_27090 [Actinophytocola sp.]|uniref:hypothetical protein n=1 Tax=Actinophytocola sp. TaxID=1872138 RepID=UPI002DBBBF0A|nr:hypothetical protein [Actinophytocola sp.]HEU5474329.1 hypothetical protein [Actinophytocola sp.]